MARRLSLAQQQKRLAANQREYDAIKARVADVGYICEGSLVERWTSCGKPNCRCVDPDQRHGPYFQLSWKQDGRTVSERLSPEHADLYREWIANRRQLETLIKQMQAVSLQAGQHALDAATEAEAAPTITPPAPPQRRQPRKRTVQNRGYQPHPPITPHFPRPNTPSNPIKPTITSTFTVVPK